MANKFEEELARMDAEDSSAQPQPPPQPKTGMNKFERELMSMDKEPAFDFAKPDQITPDQSFSGQGAGFEIVGLDQPQEPTPKPQPKRDTLGEHAKKSWGRLKETWKDPIKRSKIALDILALPFRDFVQMFDEDTQRKFFARIGEPYYTPRELAQMPPRQRADEIARQQGIVANFSDEIFNYGDALGAIPVASLEGVAGAMRRYSEAANSGRDDAFSHAMKPIGETLKAIPSEIAKEGVDLALHPLETVHKKPVTAMTTVAGAAKPIAGAARYGKAGAWGVAERVSDAAEAGVPLARATEYVAGKTGNALSRVERAAAAVDDASQIGNLLKKGQRVGADATATVLGDEAARYFWDPGYGLRKEVRRDLVDSKRRMRGAAEEKIMKAQEEGFRGVSKKDTPAVIKALTRDDARLKIENITGKRLQLMRDWRRIKMSGKYSDEQLQAMLDSPTVLDAVRRVDLGEDPLAVELSMADTYGSVRFLYGYPTVDGKGQRSMSSIAFLLDTRPIDPERIFIEVAENAPEAVKRNADNILAIRKAQTRLANELSDGNIDFGIGPDKYSATYEKLDSIRDRMLGDEGIVPRVEIESVGGKGKKGKKGKGEKTSIEQGYTALGKDVARARADSYLADIYQKVRDPDEYVLRSFGVSPSRAGSLQMSHIKDSAALEEKAALGLLSVKNLEAAVVNDIVNKTIVVEKFKLFDRLSRGSHGLVKSGTPEAHGLRLVRDKGGVEIYKDADGKVFVRDTRKLSGTELPKMGALSRRFVSKALYDNLGNLSDETNRFVRLLTRANSAWKSGKVVMNPASHFNQLFDNLVVKQTLDGGAPLISYAIGMRELRKKGDYYKLARRLGILGTRAGVAVDIPDAIVNRMAKASGPQSLMEDVLMPLYRNPKKFMEGVRERAGLGELGGADIAHAIGDKVVGAYERATIDNPLARGAALTFQAADDASRIAMLRRWVKREADLVGYTPELLVEKMMRGEGSGFGKRAREHIFSWFFDYEDTPRFIHDLDRFGIVPFARYSATITPKLAGEITKRPYLSSALREGEEMRKYDVSGEDQKRQELQSVWSEGRAVRADNLAAALNKLGGKLGMGELIIGKNQDFNTRYLSPMPVGWKDISGIERGGGTGARKYSDALRFIPSGPVGSVLGFLFGEDLEFGREIGAGYQGVVGERIAPRLDYMVKQFGPGILYHLDNKVLAAFTGVKDSRGREMSPWGAVLNMFGGRFEKSDPKRQQGFIDWGYDDAMYAAKKKMREGLARFENDREKADQVRKDYREELERLRQVREQMLMGLRH